MWVQERFKLADPGFAIFERVSGSDEAIIRVLAGSGARLSEVTHLRIEDVDLFGQALRVTGKGRQSHSNPHPQ